MRMLVRESSCVQVFLSKLKGGGRGVRCFRVGDTPGLFLTHIHRLLPVPHSAWEAYIVPPSSLASRDHMATRRSPPLSLVPLPW